MSCRRIAGSCFRTSSTLITPTIHPGEGPKRAKTFAAAPTGIVALAAELSLILAVR